MFTVSLVQNDEFFYIMVIYTQTTHIVAEINISKFDILNDTDYIGHNTYKLNHSHHVATTLF